MASLDEVMNEVEKFFLLSPQKKTLYILCGPQVTRILRRYRPKPNQSARKFKQRALRKKAK